jgi:ribosome-associated protein
MSKKAAPEKSLLTAPRTKSTRDKVAPTLDTFHRAALAAQYADERKALDITLLDVRGLCNFTDVFIVCTGNNRVQLNAISESVATGMKKLGAHTPLTDGHRNGNWAVLDYGDFVVHVMSAEARAFYRLEKLWGDAKEINWPEVLSTAPVAVGAGE